MCSNGQYFAISVVEKQVDNFQYYRETNDKGLDFSFTGIWDLLIYAKLSQWINSQS